MGATDLRRPYIRGLYSVKGVTHILAAIAHGVTDDASTRLGPATRQSGVRALASALGTLRLS
ncbi:hypothetical protein C8Q74DRAFT_1238625 [Fomes fomentarius]|nr:hypothetical protein C8Q74DRAFT_1238625 [Fomes fomentarius]